MSYHNDNYDNDGNGKLLKNILVGCFAWWVRSGSESCHRIISPVCPILDPFSPYLYDDDDYYYDDDDDDDDDEDEDDDEEDNDDDNFLRLSNLGSIFLLILMMMMMMI